ncbi:hypothetical protein A5819_001542 [Enterococcus sp. 7E2_DIV0204]|uniref:hypothetical protein n=1 Tax=unclassified Enterococcus TaxID=2608891 RepID=UPI000A344B6D|nr:MULTISPECIES: hypothetical protein [unclassified Enterococcus]OTN89050.1 hypothetical protein A5819_001542 [Enterococcus sp. 7E2_DIV0204]OTP51505.1 hypothetical protein A5884_000700 [Enterococcus sp. 7D2_DIV0200]
MDKKMLEKIQDEMKIPASAMKKINKNREDILNGQFIQHKKVVQRNFQKKVLMFTLVAAATGLLILSFKTPISGAMEELFGISRDPAVQAIEEKDIATKINLSSIQNGREIKLTKFVSTPTKIAFDYELEIDDELRLLIEKNSKIATENPLIKGGPTMQHIRFGLFEEGNTEDLIGGGGAGSTFRLEGNKLYGTGTANFSRDKVSDNAKLTLHIYELSWQDYEQFQTVMVEAMEENSPAFSVPNVIQYEGDWSFDIEHKPITTTKTPQIKNIDQVTDIKVKSDALQTIARFKAPIELADPEDHLALPKKMYSSNLFKNGVNVNQELNMVSWNPKTGEFKISFNLSALDMETTYRVQIDEIDNLTGESVKEIGSFEVKNN